jgi:hypothetical protein
MLAVVCPSRGRPQSLSAMVQSALATSKADVLIYVDKDDIPSTRLSFDDERVNILIGEPQGRGRAVNALCDTFSGRRGYLVVSDDIVFTRPGWDAEIEQAMDAFSNDIGLVHLKGSNTQQTTGEPWVNWACVSRNWLDTLGWFNYPELEHFCQDTVLQVLAEALGRIVQLPEVMLHHACIDHPQMRERLQGDAERFLWFCAKDFASCLDKLKRAT